MKYFKNVIVEFKDGTTEFFDDVINVDYTDDTLLTITEKTLYNGKGGVFSIKRETNLFRSEIEKVIMEER